MKNQIQIQTQETLPALSFNFDELKAWAVGMTERYKNLVVTEDAIADVKRDMAELNKAKKAVDDARKEAVRRISEPIRTFEAQIKEICGIFDATYSALGDQIKKFEGIQRDEKRKKIVEITDEVFSEKFGPDTDQWPKLSVPVQDRWLNKSTTMKSIRDDIGVIIDRHIEEEQRKRALEQARKDRVASIESHVKALNQHHGFSFSVSKFIDGRALNMDIPLDQILSGIGTYFERMVPKPSPKPDSSQVTTPVQAQTPTPEQKKPEEKNPDPAHQPETPAPTARKTSAMSIIIEYDQRNEDQIMACLKEIKALCINYAERRR